MSQREKQGRFFETIPIAGKLSDLTGKRGSISTNRNDRQNNGKFTAL
jgi:hypothetical protein